MILLRRIILICTMFTAWAASASATLGGPDLARPLGWDTSTKEAFFAIEHNGESGLAATIVRLRLDGPDTVACEPVWWSKQAEWDSTYEALYDRLMKRLTPLVEDPATTVPAMSEVKRVGTHKTPWDGPYARYRVSGFFRGGEGRVEAITYVDSSLRMIRRFYVKELGVSIGVFSFVGIPFEGGHEFQVPAIVPSERGTHVLLEWKRGW